MKTVWSVGTEPKLFSTHNCADGPGHRLGKRPDACFTSPKGEEAFSPIPLRETKTRHIAILTKAKTNADPPPDHLRSAAPLLQQGGFLGFFYAVMIAVIRMFCEGTTDVLPSQLGNSLRPPRPSGLEQMEKPKGGDIATQAGRWSARSAVRLGTNGPKHFAASQISTEVGGCSPFS